MKIVFSTDDVHARDRLEFWHEHASKAAVPHEFDSRVGRSFNGSISMGKLGALDLSLIESDPCEVRRTNDYIARATHDDLLLNLQLAGGLVLHQDGRDAATQPNDLFLLDARRPFFVDVRHSIRVLLVKIPRWELQGRLGDMSLLTARPINAGEPIAALAAGFLAMLPKRISAFDAMTGPKVAQHMLDLVALAFGRMLQTGSIALSASRMTTLVRLKAMIEARLDDPGLRPAHAAEATGISVRYANALLGHEGTSLERFIMLRRLQHCRRALEDPSQAGRTISDIAYSLGFSDMSHFTRRFKAQFGFSPSTCRHQAIRSLPSPPQDA
jgi:AraC family transcriptional regulator, positive regulator of tynA and feaB